MNPANVPASVDASLRLALTGVWLVDRRASDVDARFVRLTLYRDGRFGTLAADGRTVVYGDWRVIPDTARASRPPSAPDESHDPDAPRALLTLRFDHHPDPSMAYRVSMGGNPVGPLVLADAAGGARLVLRRAEPVEGGLIGRWQPVPHAPRACDELELRGDGVFAQRLPGGVVRTGRWSFVRDTAAGAPVRGVLQLDPADTTLPREQWPATLTPGAHPTLNLTPSAGGPSLPLRRASLDPAVRTLVATWRLTTPPGSTVAPQELVLRANGTLEVFARPGTPRVAGRWNFARTSPRRDALEGVLTLTVTPPGQAPRREQPTVVLPFTRLGELAVTRDAEHPPLRYRRFFR